ncbi:hypothetical protein QUF84_22420 [Fictibacillus enclensis]|uniref:hypothetical protein n=1 Tax=Fictibacillus enclensis TaxID=1017270 RepID=UPI0025A057EE|nr:hypothetical protein [Fictibacillus enclensis]MDM5339956.1 hypothetical protein [Fictibacillus enclensis]
MRDSGGKSGTDETRKAFRRSSRASDEKVGVYAGKVGVYAGKVGVYAGKAGDYASQAQRPPAESERSGTEINHFQK